VTLMLSLPRARSRYVLRPQCPLITDTTARLLQRRNDSSHSLRLSSGSGIVESEQSNDEDDEGTSTGLEEWHGFQDIISDGVSTDEGLHPPLPPDSLPMPVQSTRGTPGTSKLPFRDSVLELVT
jgi:hypothetical protein